MFSDANAYTQQFDKKMTNRIKGVALIFMLFHHFFGFPQWYVDGVSYADCNILGMNIAYWVQTACKICVPMFAFLTGWGYFFAKEKTLKYSCKKIITFLINYWIILFGIFLPCYLFFSEEVITVGRIMKNMLALEVDGLVKFAWYVYFYVFSMIVLPFWVKKLSGKTLLDLGLTIISCVFVINLCKYIHISKQYLVAALVDSLYWFTCLATGYICARDGIFKKMYDYFYSPGKIKSLLVIVIVLGCRMKWQTALGVPLDILYATIVIFELINLLNDKGFSVPNKVIGFVGVHATNVWFLHSAFFDEITIFVQKYAYLPKNPILVVIWAFVLCLPFSLLINCIMKFITKGINRIL